MRETVLQLHPVPMRLRAAAVTGPRVTPIAAIVTPAFRPAAHLSEAAALAGNLGIPLIVLASGKCDPADIPAPATIIDFGDHTPVHPHPALPGQVHRDLAAKRNFGLQIAASHGYPAIFFLDDDITGVTPRHLHWATRKLGEGYDAACLRITDYPDNSVIRHAQRATGKHVPIHPSCSATALNTRRDWPPCPDIYCEDWHLLHGRAIAYPGPGVHQDPYNPYTPGRAASEEAGDLIAEAIRTPRAEPLNPGWWSRQITQREQLARDIARHTTSPEILASLAEASRVRAQIDGHMLAGWASQHINGGSILRPGLIAERSHKPRDFSHPHYGE